MQCKSYSHFFSKKFQHIRVSLDLNFNESLTNDIVSFEQLGADLQTDVQMDKMTKTIYITPAIFYMSGEIKWGKRGLRHYMDEDLCNA